MSYISRRVICDCGAVYEISESDEASDCGNIEIFDCHCCGKRLASHFGDLEGFLIDDSNVSEDVKLEYKNRWLI